METTRRSLLVGGLSSLFVAPAIVKAANLMPVRSIGYWDGVLRKKAEPIS